LGGESERRLQAKDHRGGRPYSPLMMTALLLYAYAVGVFSSRKIERVTFADVAFRVLATGEHPHFRTINEFRATHRATFVDLFQQVLKVCMAAGLVKLGHVAIDGTKMKANASKHKAMSYDHELRPHGEGGDPPQSRDRALISRTEATDAAEDKLYGAGQQPMDLPAELQRRKGRREKICEPPADPSGTPKPEAQRNFTDPESRITGS
jgi:transposase